ncbi:MAG: ChrR family anti-sigma-E factor [Cellvibrio sp.]|uniref:ChrR family anti-sigma-E factor n=1 Tax=Cellvibrio sp. TaxID=1965322 RepID=UPI002720D36E|nr:ChrR family anti-sigma-E factor [Cellvibrio sp.]
MSAYHPDDMTLMNYAAGSCNIPESLAVAMHLCFCHDCRQHVKNLNHLGGALLETIKPASTDEEAFESLMTSLEPHDHNAPAKVKMEPTQSDKITQHFTNPLLRYLPTSFADLPWQRQTKEISKFDLTSLINVQGFQVALQKISAGAKVPKHTHKGFEYTVILSGGYSDELGVYHEGDFIARDASHKHSPTALQNEDCICLTVLNAPLKFTGWYRVLNPFMAWS